MCFAQISVLYSYYVFYMYIYCLSRERSCRLLFSSPKLKPNSMKMCWYLCVLYAIYSWKVIALCTRFRRLTFISHNAHFDFAVKCSRFLLSLFRSRFHKKCQAKRSLFYIFYSILLYLCYIYAYNHNTKSIQYLLRSFLLWLSYLQFQ